MNWLKTKWSIILLPLYVILVFILISFLNSYAHTSADKYYLTPLFQNQNGWEIYTLKDGVRKDISTQELSENQGETVYLTQVLEPAWEEAGYTILELSGTTWQHSVFLDGNLLYSVDPTLENEIGSIEFPKEYQGIQGPQEYVRFTLPPGYGGKTLTIAGAANATSQHPGMPSIRLSSEKIQTELLVSEVTKITIPATIYMTVALLLLGLFLYNWYHKQTSFDILLLMLAALFQAFRVLLNFGMYINSAYSWDLFPSDILIPLAFGFPMLYLLMQMKRWKTYFAPLILLPLVCTISFHLLARTEMFAMISQYQYDAMLYISLLALCVFAWLEWNSNNPVYRLFTPVFYGVIACLGVLVLGLIVRGQAQAELVVIVTSPITMNYESLLLYGNILLLLSFLTSFISTIRKSAQTQSELSVMQVKNELISENIQTIQQSSLEIAKLRHDMLRHFHTILDLSQEKEQERLETYVKELTRETEAILPLKICNHPIINALVTRAMAKAKNQDIQMVVRVAVCEKLAISDRDLCTFVMNMLDNAIEAVAQLPKERKRTIEFTMHIQGSYLFIETVNGYDDRNIRKASSGLLLSTRGEGHGYGMKAMADIAKKYHSKLQIKQEQGMITIRTALLIPETSDNSSNQGEL